MTPHSALALLILTLVLAAAVLRWLARSCFRGVAFKFGRQDIYDTHWQKDHRGTLIVTRWFIIATGTYAHVWI